MTAQWEENKYYKKIIPTWKENKYYKRSAFKAEVLTGYDWEDIAFYAGTLNEEVARLNNFTFLPKSSSFSIGTVINTNNETFLPTFIAN